ncbi:hypothetical protein D3C78_695460 [compost metagenome]
MVVDLSFIGSFFDQVSLFFQYIWDWFRQGVYEFVQDAFVVATKVAIYSYIQMSLFLVDVAYEVVMDILADLNIAQYVESAYSSIPEAMRSVLEFFGIPQALTIIFAAIPTRLAMRFVPFIGR